MEGIMDYFVNNPNKGIKSLASKENDYIALDTILSQIEEKLNQIESDLNM